MQPICSTAVVLTIGTNDIVIMVIGSLARASTSTRIMMLMTAVVTMTFTPVTTDFKIATLFAGTRITTPLLLVSLHLYCRFQYVWL